MMGGGVFADRQINVSVNPNTTVTRTTNIKTALLPDNNLALAGHYTAHFTGINSTLTFVTSDSDNDHQQCTSESQGVAPIAFTVQAAVLDSCQIQETSDFMLGSYSASQTNIPTWLPSKYIISAEHALSRYQSDTCSCEALSQDSPQSLVSRYKGVSASSVNSS